MTMMAPTLKVCSIVAKPAKKPDKPNTEDQILQVLIMLWEAIGRTNRILKHTEARNEVRHQELLKAISADQNDATKVTYTKVRREPIPQP